MWLYHAHDFQRRLLTLLYWSAYFYFYLFYVLLYGCGLFAVSNEEFDDDGDDDDDELTVNNFCQFPVVAK